MQESAQQLTAEKQQQDSPSASWSLVAVILARWGLFKGFWYMGMEHTRHGTGHSLRPSAF